MESGIAQLASVIGAHIRHWEPSPPHVELAIHGTADPGAIARSLDAFCRRHLGAAVTRALFHQASIGSVSGVTLDDGRSVVIKAHQPNRSRDFLEEIVRLQTHLTNSCRFAAPVLAGPHSLGAGYAIVEEYRAIGRTREAHEPKIRRVLVESFRTIVTECRPFVGSTSLPALLQPGKGELWPEPHGKIFDFKGTALGAEWIDEIAALALERMAPIGERIIGHCDWRQEHVRFLGDDIAVAYDWDALVCDAESVLLGVVAHGFCSDWSEDDRRQAPTVEEARAFRHEYEEARGDTLSSEEGRVFAASFTYACAYTSRCGHALGLDQREYPGSFQNLLWHERDRLLAL